MPEIKILPKSDQVPQVINDLIKNRDDIRELAVTYIDKNNRIHTRFSAGVSRLMRIGMLTDLAHELSHAG